MSPCSRRRRGPEEFHYWSTHCGKILLWKYDLFGWSLGVEENTHPRKYDNKFAFNICKDRNLTFEFKESPVTIFKTANTLYQFFWCFLVALLYLALEPVYRNSSHILLIFKWLCFPSFFFFSVCNFCYVLSTWFAKQVKCFLKGVCYIKVCFFHKLISLVTPYTMQNLWKLPKF